MKRLRIVEFGSRNKEEFESATLAVVPPPAVCAFFLRRLRVWLATAAIAASSVLYAQDSARDPVRSKQSSRATNGEWRSSSNDRQADSARSSQRPSRDNRPANEDRESPEEQESEKSFAPSVSTRDTSSLSEPSSARNGQVWREYSISPYTSRLPAIPHPEQAIVDWILNRSGPETWHGEDAAVLSATRAKLRVYHRPEVQSQVADIVDRFVRPIQPQVSMRVQTVYCTDMDWRSGLVHLLKPEAIGTEGQQVWMIAPEDAALIRERLRVNRQPGTAIEQQIMAQIGQPSTVETGRGVNYISGLELMGGLYVAYQPVISRLNEGVKGKFTPLWTSDGSGVDLDMKLTTRAVTRLHYAQSAVPLASGNQKAAVQVPEVAATWLEHMVHWPRSQVLLISAGVHPGIAGAKRSGLSFSPQPIEILILAEIDPPVSNRSATRRDSSSNR